MSINSYEGIYYAPNSEILFKGEMANAIFIFIRNRIKLFDDEGKLIYDPDIYKEEIISKKAEKNDAPINIQGVCNIIVIDRKFSNKCNLLGKFKNLFNFSDSLSNIGINKDVFYLEYKMKSYKCIIWQTVGVERFKSLPKKYYQNSDIILIIFDLTDENDFNDNLLMIKDINTNSYDRKPLIYLIGVKLDKANEIVLEIIRQKSKVLLDTGKINKYFEITEENGEDFDKFTKIFEIDCAITANTSDDKNEINDSLKSGKKNKCIIF